MRNNYPGTCSVCRAAVAAQQGEYDTVTRKVKCSACAGTRPTAPPRVIVTRLGRGVAFKPTSFLGRDLFQTYRNATAGAVFDAFNNMQGFDRNDQEQRARSQGPDGMRPPSGDPSK